MAILNTFGATLIAGGSTAVSAKISTDHTRTLNKNKMFGSLLGSTLSTLGTLAVQTLDNGLPPSYKSATTEYQWTKENTDGLYSLLDVLDFIATLDDETQSKVVERVLQKKSALLAQGQSALSEQEQAILFEQGQSAISTQEQQVAKKKLKRL